jgi:hypothetical protein
LNVATPDVGRTELSRRASCHLSSAARRRDPLSILAGVAIESQHLRAAVNRVAAGLPSRLDVPQTPREGPRVLNIREEAPPADIDPLNSSGQVICAEQQRVEVAVSRTSSFLSLLFSKSKQSQSSSCTIHIHIPVITYNVLSPSICILGTYSYLIFLLMYLLTTLFTATSAIW